MAFPFLSEENFEDMAGALRVTAASSPDIKDNTHFDSETDTTGLLSVEHYSELARTPGIGMPYSGSYALRAELSGGTTDGVLTETGSWDTTATNTIYHRLMVWFGGPNVAMANNNIFQFFGLLAGATTEVSVGVLYTTAGGYQLYGNETSSASGAVTGSLTLNEWHTVEVESLIDSGGGNDGTVQVWLDGTSLGTVSTLDQGAITSGVIGVTGPDAGTTGTLLFDSVVADDARIYPPTTRFTETLTLTKSGHAMLGPGQLKNITLLSGANADNLVEVFDSNRGDATDAGNAKIRLFGTSASDQEVIDPAGVPVDIERGAYVKLTGTADAYGPRAIVQICPDTAYGSDGSIRDYGLRS